MHDDSTNATDGRIIGREGNPGVQLPKLLITAREAARTLSVSERTLWTLTKSGQVSAVRVGRSVRYTQADLEAFIASHKGVANG